MLLRRQLKAGVLLYALLISAIFVMLLQFYVSRVIVSHEEIRLMNKANIAYMMAHLTKEGAKKSQEEISFSHGKVHYQQKDDYLEVTSILNSGESFTYRFKRKLSPPTEIMQQEDQEKEKTLKNQAMVKP